MFKKPLLAVAIVGAIAVSDGCAQTPPAASDTAADLARLQADALAWFDLFNKGDADGMANLYTDDAVLMPPGAPASTGRAAIREFVAAEIGKSKAAGGTFKNGAFTGMGVSADTAWLSGTYLFVDASGATLDTGKWLTVHRRTSGVWRLIRDTWNSDKAAATTPPARTF